ncbi:hypothetical protein Tco_0432575 [Tanacetum coccineum]
MNHQETQQVAPRDEKYVPFTKRVKISSTNVRLETIVPQKEETFQVVIDLVKNSSCFKAFTISTDVPEIFMHQFWYSIKKVQGTDSYEFLLANKKCVVNADVFRTILDICQRVEGVNFTDVPDDDTTLAFLIKLGYKGSFIMRPLRGGVSTVCVLQNAINATKLDILLVTVGVREMPTMLTIRGALGQARNLLASSVEFKDTSRGNAQS